MRLLVAPARHVGRVMDACEVDLVLSLISPDARAPELPVAGPPSIVLRFNDIIEPREGLAPPSRSMMEKILAVATAYQTVLIHCHAGISRSTAAAYALACQYQGPGHEVELAAQLRGRSPAATPNAWMVAFADDLLRRDGRMISAMRQIGRGEDAYEGSTIDWRLQRD